MAAEPKEWLKVKHSPSGTTATVTLQEDNLTVSWSVKTYVGQIKDGIREARLGAQRAMVDLREVANSGAAQTERVA